MISNELTTTLLDAGYPSSSPFDFQSIMDAIEALPGTSFDMLVRDFTGFTAYADLGECGYNAIGETSTIALARLFLKLAR